MNPVGKSQREEIHEFLAATDKVQAVKNEIEAKIPRVQQFGVRIEGAALHGELEALPPRNSPTGQVGSGEQTAQSVDTGATPIKALESESVGG